VGEYQIQAWMLARYLLKEALEATDVHQEVFVKALAPSGLDRQIQGL